MKLAWLDRISISKKVPALVMAAATTVAVGVGTLAYNSAAHIEHAQAEMHFDSILHSSENALHQYLDSLVEDLEVLAASPLTHQALSAFSAGFAEIGDPHSALQRLYIDNNPNPAGERHLLEDARDGSAYSMAHNTYHGAFRTQLDVRGYADIALLDTRGNLVYSVAKEPDFASNFVSGEWAKSDLGIVYQASMDATGEDFVVSRISTPTRPAAEPPPASWQNPSSPTAARSASSPCACRSTGSTRS